MRMLFFWVGGIFVGSGYVWDEPKEIGLGLLFTLIAIGAGCASSRKPKQVVVPPLLICYGTWYQSKRNAGTNRT
jgi:hypothetical protein